MWICPTLGKVAHGFESEVWTLYSLHHRARLTWVVDGRQGELIRHVQVDESERVVELRHGRVGERPELGGEAHAQERVANTRHVVLVHEADTVAGRHPDALLACQVDLRTVSVTLLRSLTPGFGL